MKNACRVWLVVLSLAIGVSTVALAQDEAPLPPPEEDTTLPVSKEVYENLYMGEFTPGSGFDLIKTKRGSLNISVYGLFRYVNQMPGTQTFTDHLGRERDVKARNDLYWHRSMIWLTGFFYDNRLRYNMTVWSLSTTQQALVFGNLRYIVGKALTLGAGLGPNLTHRSMAGSWPYWAASDRQMMEDAMRGGFASCFFVSGSPLSRFFYTASVNTNISQLGVTATNDSRDMAYSATVFWMPTTGELGPRGGFGDLEHHEQLATRFGLSACHARESRAAPLDQPPNSTMIRMSDGVYPFEAGALADGVTVNKLDYENISVDAAFKYRGFSFLTEYTVRELSNFDATGPLPLTSILDQGVFAEAMHMVVPKYLGLYAATSYLFDDFQRHPWEIAGGANFYPFGNRQWRINLHVIRIDQSPAGSTFGYYTAGQSGTTVSLGTDFLL
jgi:hypothetical protein